MNQRNTSTTWALLLGCLCFVAGGTLAVSKHIDPTFGQYAASIGRAMANGGMLALFGLVLVAVHASAASGGSADSGKTSSNGADQSLLLEQLAGDMARLRGELETMRNAQESAATQAAAATGQLHDDDRLFRLAAGIDQLGARVEGRLKTQHGATLDAIDGLGREVQALLERVAELESDTNGGFERLAHGMTGGEQSAPEIGFEWAANCGLPDGDCTSDGFDGAETAASATMAADPADAGRKTKTAADDDESGQSIEDGAWFVPAVEVETSRSTATTMDAPAWTMDAPAALQDDTCDGGSPTAVRGSETDHQDDPYAATPEPEIELAQGFESSDDDLEVSVEFDNEPETVHAAGAPGLGILDSIEAPQSALPQAQPGEHLDAKLAALKELMGDPEVRKALDALQRGG